MNANVIKKIFTIIMLLTFITFGYNQCSQKSTLNNGSTDRSPSAVVQSAPSSPSLADIVTKSGVRNFNQALTFVTSATGIEKGTNHYANVVNHFRNIENQLPVANDVKAFNASNTIGFISLAAQACNRMITQNDLRVNFFADYNANRNFSQMSDDDFIQAFQIMMAKFFPPKIYMNNEFKEQTNNDLLTLIQENYRDDPAEGENQATTRRALGASCAVLLTSAATYQGF